VKIVVVGLGYVGLSNAVLLAQHNQVIGVDISSDRVNALNARKSIIDDDELSNYLISAELKLSASLDLNLSVSNADYVIVSTPTNYDYESNRFDTSSVEAVIAQVVKSAPKACIVVKSTIPIGFIDNVRKKYGSDNVLFSPEFLREGRALYDNLHPSRIVIGEKSQRAIQFAELLKNAAIKDNIELVFTGTKEAEAIKLFSNTYLAMRVAYFNEVDSYAMINGLNASELVNGISMDPRIGQHYNNPSFGYGGYCLPKDTKQLLANFNNTPQNLIGAIVESNETRKKLIASEIVKLKPNTVGVYRLAMKKNSDNFRESSIRGIINELSQSNLNLLIYEPGHNESHFHGIPVTHDIQFFGDRSDVIVANRLDGLLHEIRKPIFTRDIFGTD
jgi:UDPglucose 6-dehydrogenase